jgi:hypothetical protein
MNSLRSALTPLRAGLKIQPGRRRETSKLVLPGTYLRSYTLYQTGTNSRSGHRTATAGLNIQPFTDYAVMSCGAPEDTSCSLRSRVMVS